MGAEDGVFVSMGDHLRVCERADEGRPWERGSGRGGREFS
ncbi:hypothetical protein P376_1529 [Streptomyces sp. HCCB10043]|nr:hypothetical protein P376_1529 [Streptomyces sp. HCCB10043]